MIDFDEAAIEATAAAAAAAQIDACASAVVSLSVLSPSTHTTTTTAAVAETDKAAFSPSHAGTATGTGVSDSMYESESLPAGVCVQANEPEAADGSERQPAACVSPKAFCVDADACVSAQISSPPPTPLPFTAATTAATAASATTTTAATATAATAATTAAATATATAAALQAPTPTGSKKEESGASPARKRTLVRSDSVLQAINRLFGRSANASSSSLLDTPTFALATTTATAAAASPDSMAARAMSPTAKPAAVESKGPFSLQRKTSKAALTGLASPAGSAAALRMSVEGPSTSTPLTQSHVGASAMDAKETPLAGPAESDEASLSCSFTTYLESVSSTSQPPTAAAATNLPPAPTRRAPPPPVPRRRPGPAAIAAAGSKEGRSTAITGHAVPLPRTSSAALVLPAAPPRPAPPRPAARPASMAAAAVPPRPAARPASMVAAAVPPRPAARPASMVIAPPRPTTRPPATVQATARVSVDRGQQALATTAATAAATTAAATAAAAAATAAAAAATAAAATSSASSVSPLRTSGGSSSMLGVVPPSPASRGKRVPPPVPARRRAPAAPSALSHASGPESLTVKAEPVSLAQATESKSTASIRILDDPAEERSSFFSRGAAGPTSKSSERLGKGGSYSSLAAAHTPAAASGTGAKNCDAVTKAPNGACLAAARPAWMVEWECRRRSMNTRGSGIVNTLGPDGSSPTSNAASAHGSRLNLASLATTTTATHTSSSTSTSTTSKSAATATHTPLFSLRPRSTIGTPAATSTASIGVGAAGGVGDVSSSFVSSVAGPASIRSGNASVSLAPWQREIRARKGLDSAITKADTQTAPDRLGRRCSQL
jgi:trimeric autotransporter adhesin